jgi:hypothetical protein
MGLDLNELRDRLDNVLNQETADSLNEWLNNKRDMTDEQIARIQLIDVLDNVQSIMHELALDEMDELIDELIHLYERYNIYASTRNGEKPE